MATDDVHREMRSLMRAVNMMWLLAAVSLVGGIIAGAILATTSEETGPFGQDENPYLGAGIATAVGGIVTATVLVFFANWAAAWVAVHRPPARRAAIPPPPVVR